MKINIGYTVSDLHTHILSVSILSLLENSSREDEFNIFVLNSDISPESKRKIESLKRSKDFYIEYVNMDNGDFNGIAKGVSVVSNYRIKIASVKPELDKIIFLDSDILIMDSLADLYNTELGDNYIGAVVDPGAQLQRQYTIKDDDKFPNPRFNTGLMLINLKKWREDNIEQKLFDGMKWYSTKYKAWPDQNVIQMVCKDKILSLDPVYNVSPILEQQNLYQIPGLWEQSSKNPKIIHVCGMPKYWQDIRLQWNDIFWKYARKSPYYEEFIDCLSDRKIKNVNQNIKTLSEKRDLIIKGLNVRIKNIEEHLQEKRASKSFYIALHPIYFNLTKLRYRLMKHITFGKKKEKYKAKYKALKSEIKAARLFVKELKKSIK